MDTYTVELQHGIDVRELTTVSRYERVGMSEVLRECVIQGCTHEEADIIASALQDECLWAVSLRMAESHSASANTWHVTVTRI